MRIATAFVVLAIGVVAASCTVNEPGSPRPQTATASVESPGNSSVDSRGIFGDLKACAVLDEALKGQGFPPGRVSNSGSNNGCQAEKTGVAARVDLDDLQGIDQLSGDPSLIYEGDVSGRAAKLRKDPDNGTIGCSVAMKVAAKARALVRIGFGSDGTVDAACEQAKAVAEAIEPQLPKA